MKIEFFISFSLLNLSYYILALRKITFFVLQPLPVTRSIAYMLVIE